MQKTIRLLTLALLAASPGRAADAPPPLPLLDLAAPDAANRFVPTSDQVTVAPGVVITIQPGKESYPGARLNPPAGKAWDLSAYGHVEARVVNTGEKASSISLRVDNAGDWQKNPWNTESIHLKPGATGTVSVIFGYQYGKKPGYPLDPGQVVSILLFTGKSDVEQSFRLESLQAAGPAGEKPPVDPKTIRIKPGQEGLIYGDGIKDVLITNDARSVIFKPAVGRWDLRLATEVRIKLKNTGATPVTPTAQLLSNEGPTDPVTAAPLAAGAETVIVVPFAAAIPWNGPQNIEGQTHLKGVKETGTEFISDAVSGVKISAPDGIANLAVESIAAAAGIAKVPDWLGKRPPVEGDWTLTFAEEFDGAEIDQTRWNIYTANYWDKRSHFTKDNLILGGGLVRLRYEKKTGFHNDDPAGKQTDYAVGFLDTYGKWTQRYGYFEARMKLPTAPGLWPAFWMMPDRGAEVGPQWKRADTANGGMEFDIMEHLTRWGPHRYNIAMHWDGYQKGHKATGTTKIYCEPDAEGFITAGLLWTPGFVGFYCNGREVARWEHPRISVIPSYPILYMVSGGWDNNALDDAQLPADFVVDYVRCWQRKDLASERDGPKGPVPPPRFPAPATGAVDTTD